ncbi:MAG: bifunctional (p)ppGpp synthetase/guanosine-3',5'-bis(diphosphate) 3'-pyrophosphohydrolase, partial [candidate division Zixibacteria bacterium]|nr:bifunctional (p)ppGpp synthetase/guanosine-3',5'-bis(diphosphate) 3'-pyrophosphohydrolase [candidate division Zixibacteria bacterium]
KGKFNPKDVERFQWLRGIMDWQRELTDSREVVANLRFDLFQDEVYVFTPKGDVKELPEGATAVDLAFLIHTAIGEHCAGAKVNGRLVPLDTPLKNGDTVEIITDKNRRPNRDWLKFVKTAKARTRVKHFIRTEERERSIVLGRDMLDKQGRKDGVNVAKAIKDGSMLALARDMSMSSVEDVLSAVGYSRITPKKIIVRLMPKREGEEAEAAAHKAEAHAHAPATPESGHVPKGKPGESVRIEGVDNVLVRLEAPLVAIYERVRKGKGSGAVVAVKNKACSGCFKTLPPQLVQEIRRAERIITCDSCGRILIWSEEGGC